MRGSLSDGEGASEPNIHTAAGLSSWVGLHQLSRRIPVFLSNFQPVHRLFFGAHPWRECLRCPGVSSHTDLNPIGLELHPDGVIKS